MVILFLRSLLLSLALGWPCVAVLAQPHPVEIHQRIVLPDASARQIALTLDACSGRFDAELIRFLIEHRIAATLFATKRWLDRNPAGIALIKAHLDLFAVEDHGERHIPAVIGPGRAVYGIAGHPDAAHLRREVTEGARAIEAAIGTAPHWYRAATAVYDQESVQIIAELGYKIAGFSVNADVGATLDQAAIVKRLRRVKPGDVIIAHMNHPESETAEGLSAGLAALQAQGYVFVRLDQVELRELPAGAARAPARTP